MNYLIDDYPTSLWVNGKEYPIDADWQNCLLVILALEDKDLSHDEKVIILLERIYDSAPPDDYQSAVDEAFRFLDCFEEKKKQTHERQYSFQQDSKFILSAINQTRKESIKKAEFLHWWEFCSLFMEISGESMFSQIISIRKRMKSGKLTKEERQLVAEHPEIYVLREEVSDSRKAAVDEFRAQLEGGTKSGG